MTAGELLPDGATTSGERVAIDAGGEPLWARVVRARTERLPVLYLHGIESHGAWFLPAAAGLAAHDYTVWMPDRRGSGLNRHAEANGSTAAQLVHDVAAARRTAGEPLLMIGLSWGGKLAVASALAQQTGLRGLVLVTPGLASRVGLPLVSKLRLVASLLTGGRARIPIPIEPAMFTTTPRHLDYIQRDPLRLHLAPARFLASSVAIDLRLRRAHGALHVPTLLVLAGQDRIVDNDATIRRLHRICARPPEVRVYSGATHSIQFDHTDRLVADIVEFAETLGC